MQVTHDWLVGFILHTCSELSCKQRWFSSLHSACTRELPLFGNFEGRLFGKRLHLNEQISQFITSVMFFEHGAEVTPVSGAI